MLTVTCRWHFKGELLQGHNISIIFLGIVFRYMSPGKYVFMKWGFQHFFSEIYIYWVSLRQIYC